MRSREGSSRGASAKRERRYSAEEYKKKIKAMKFRSRVIGFVCNILMLAIAACAVICTINICLARKNSSHTKVTVDDLTVSERVVDKADYSARIKTAYSKGGKTYYNVTIGKYTTERSSNEVAILKQNPNFKTEIYALNIKNSDPFFLSSVIPGEITIVRYSIFGEERFTKQEIKEYKQMAANYFTYQKFMKLNYPDAEKYRTEIPNLTKKGDLRDVK